MNDVTGVVVKNLLQEKLKKYEMYYNYSYQFKDFDISDYYKKEINRIKSNLNKIYKQELDTWFKELVIKNGITNY